VNTCTAENDSIAGERRALSPQVEGHGSGRRSWRRLPDVRERFRWQKFRDFLVVSNLVEAARNRDAWRWMRGHRNLNATAHAFLRRSRVNAIDGLLALARRNECFSFDAIVNKRSILEGLDFSFASAEVEALTKRRSPATRRHKLRAITRLRLLPRATYVLLDAAARSDRNADRC